MNQYFSIETIRPIFTTGSFIVLLTISQPIRNTLPDLLKENSDWDGLVANVQATNTTKQYKEISSDHKSYRDHILYASGFESYPCDSERNWKLVLFFYTCF